MPRSMWSRPPGKGTLLPTAKVHVGPGTGAPNFGYEVEEPVLWPGHMIFDEET